MSITRSLLLALISTSCLISAAEPPPELDKALRARVEEFFQLQTARKFRQAEQMVAEDSKDYYYEAKKPDLKSFAIATVQYGPDFKTARVMLNVRMTIPLPSAIGKPLDLPFPSDWKLEGGQWCWYIDQSKLLETPFGRMNPGTDGNAAAEAAKVLNRASGASFANGVQAEPTSLSLDLAHPVPQTITLKNTLPGPVTIEPATRSPSLRIEITRPNLAADESTSVVVTPIPGSADRPAELVLRIGPLGQLVHIALDYPTR